MRHVLVTGATGFIGRHLVERLVKDGHCVRALSRTGRAASLRLEGEGWGRVEWVQGDLCDEMAMKSAAVGVDTVFHLAAKVHETHERSQNELEYERVNVGGTVNVLKAAEASGAQRLVLVSSVKAMGEGSDDEQDEETVPVPETAYGRSKLLAEEAVRRAAMSSRLQAVSLRLPMVYGPGNKGNLFRMMTAIDRGYFPPWPAVANRRSMVHVANVVEAACLSAENPVGRYECYIVTDGGPYSTRELYELMVSALGKRVPTWKVHPVALRFLARLGDAGEAILRRRLPFDTSALDKLIGSACYSSRKIARDLAFRPRVAFHTALPELTAWYRSATA